MSAANQYAQLDTNADVNTNLQKLFNFMQDNKKDSADKHTELVQKISEVQTKHESLQIEHNLLLKQHKTLQLDFLQLKSEVSDIAQQNLSSNVIINGVPEIETTDSELDQLVQNVFSGLNLATSAEVVDNKRLGKKSDDPNVKRSILVKLGNSSLKTAVIKAKRGTKDFNCGLINFKNKKLGSANEQIYINEQLSPYKAYLYSEVRKLKKSGTVKYAWINNGTVLVREKDKGRVQQISHEGDLVKLWRINDTVNGAEYDTMEESGDEIEAPQKKRRTSRTLSMAVVTRNMHKRKIK